MYNEDLNLLRAQLLIEAADLLDEGYNKPNTNDKLRAAEQRRLHGGVDKLKTDLRAAIRAGDYDKARLLQKKLNACDPKAMSRSTSPKGPINTDELNVIHNKYDDSGDSFYFKTDLMGKYHPYKNFISSDAERDARGDAEDPYKSKKIGFYKKLQDMRKGKK